MRINKKYILYGLALYAGYSTYMDSNLLDGNLPEDNLQPSNINSPEKQQILEELPEPPVPLVPELLKRLSDRFYRNSRKLKEKVFNKELFNKFINASKTKDTQMFIKLYNQMKKEDQDTNMTDAHGNNAFYYASSKGRINIIKFLLKDDTIDRYHRNKIGLNSIDILKKKNRKDILKLL